jgi:hypothetical protein
LAGGRNGNLGGLGQRVPIDAGADARDGQGRDSVFPGELNAASIARRQQHRFALTAAVPYRSNRVNDMPSRKTISLRHFRIAGPAAADTTAFSQQLGARYPMDCAADPAAGKERLVCRVDNRANAQRRDIGLNRAEGCGHNGNTLFTVGGRIV